jgi:hypothetical protein
MESSAWSMSVGNWSGWGHFSPGDLHDRGVIVLHGNRNIKQLALGSSIIEKAQDVQMVTRLFKILFPGLTGLTWDTSITGWDDENEVESQSNWELVAASMGIEMVKPLI